MEMGGHTSTADAAARVIATPAAEAAIRELVAERGKLMFFQSGGCCDGSLPICFDLGEFVLNDRDVLLGHVGGYPFYIDHRQYEAWKHTQLILDVSPGLPEGFSLPAGDGGHFVTRSRLCSPEQEPGVGAAAGCQGTTMSADARRTDAR